MQGVPFKLRNKKRRHCYMPEAVQVSHSQTLEDTDAAREVEFYRAFVEMAEEMEFEWPEFPPVQRKIVGLRKAAAGSLLFVGLLIFCYSLFSAIS
jgi:hypothetical protein